jgi:hypothetical protein
MSLPGFTAESSLTEASWNYYGARSLAPDAENMVEPQFLGVIKEFFTETVPGSVEGLVNSVVNGANELGKLIQGMQRGGGPFGGGRPIACRSLVAPLLACRNGRPAYSSAEMQSRCLGADTANSVLCFGVALGLYPLLEKACADNPNDVGGLIGRICP